jgi:hypothetical protein
MTDEIEALAHADEGCQQLITVPGIGPIISSAMVAAIGNGAAFGRANTQCSVCRFDPGRCPFITQARPPGTSLRSPETGSPNLGYRDLSGRQRPQVPNLNPRKCPQSAGYLAETRTAAPSSPPSAVDNERPVVRIPWKKTPMKRRRETYTVRRGNRYRYYVSQGSVYIIRRRTLKR